MSTSLRRPQTYATAGAGEQIYVKTGGVVTIVAPPQPGVDAEVMIKDAFGPGSSIMFMTMPNTCDGIFNFIFPEPYDCFTFRWNGDEWSKISGF